MFIGIILVLNILHVPRPYVVVVGVIQLFALAFKLASFEMITS
jgi:hypothetical protein